MKAAGSLREHDREPPARGRGRTRRRIRNKVIILALLTVGAQLISCYLR